MMMENSPREKEEKLREVENTLDKQRDKNEQFQHELNKLKNDQKYEIISLFERVGRIARILHVDESDFNFLLYMYRKFYKYDPSIWKNSIISTKYKKKKKLYI